MPSLPECPECNSEFTYEDGAMYGRQECAHAWSKDAVAESADEKRIVHGRQHSVAAR